MLRDNGTYTPRELLVELDHYLTKTHCKDCSTCPLSLGENEVDIFINGKKRYVWCYGIMLSYIMEALDNQ